jgi:uncharacterized membrane protein YjdF
MSAGIEVVDIADRWLKETLTGDATLSGMVGGRITGDDYPTDWVNPLVQYEMSSTRDTYGVGAVRIATHSVYVVKVIGEGSSYAPLRPIAQRIDALLHGARQTTAYGHIEIWREAVVRYPETVVGVRHRHLGGMYRVFAAT